MGDHFPRSLSYVAYDRLRSAGRARPPGYRIDEAHSPMTFQRSSAVGADRTGVAGRPAVPSVESPVPAAESAASAGEPAAASWPESGTRRPADRLLNAVRERRFWVLAVIIALLAQMAVGMIAAAREQSPTTDEPVYVGAAVVYVQQRSLEYNFEHPPLAKLVMATGLIFANPKINANLGSEWLVGTNVLYREGNDAQRVLFLARLPMIILTLLFGLVVFAFARDLVGPVGGLVALALYAFSPDVIGYGSLAGLDLPTAGFLLTTLWLLWRARRRPYVYLPLSGLALGAALATKMNTLPAIPVMMLLVVVSVWHAGRADGPVGVRLDRRAAARLLLTGAGAAVGVAVIAVTAVWVTYLVVDPRLRWTTPPGVPVIHGLAGRLIDGLPFPRPFRDGMRVQVGFENMTFNGFLLGDRYVGARWYYLPVALLIKEPLGMLALWIGGAAAMLATPRLRAAAPYVLLPTVALLLVAMTGARDFGVRYAIFVPVFMAVAAASVVAYRWRWSSVVTVLLLGFVAISSLRTFPLYLPYSNEAFGGPSKTYLRLGDSNVDWGQDLARLGTLVNREYPGQRVWLVYKGRGLPAYYGIRADNPFRVPAPDVRGLLAVSASRVPGAGGELGVLLGSSTKIADVGHSIFLYRR